MPPISEPDLTDALKKLAGKGYATSAERDELLEVVREAEKVAPRDLIWMLFRPDTALREAGAERLAALRSPDTVDLFLEACKGKPTAVIRGAASAFLKLNLPGLEVRLRQRLAESDDEVREAVKRLVLEAPPGSGLGLLLWDLLASCQGSERLQVLDRLAAVPQVDAKGTARWRKLAGDQERKVRERAIEVLARTAPEQNLDLIIRELPNVGAATQQALAEVLTRLSRGQGPEFADAVLPLMASASPGVRSTVIKILLGMDDRRELVKRYIVFAKTLAGWARERALDSLNAFGADLLEPTVELLSDPDEDVRAAALVVASSFADPRVVPAAIGMLSDPDWWLRVIAADTLGRTRDSRAVEPLIKALADEETRWAAVEALGRIGDNRALPALGQLLGDPSPEVRIEVLLAMRRFRHPRILEALKKVAASDPVRAVRARALEIAEEVAERDHTEIEGAEALRAAALKAQAGQGEPALHTYLVTARNQGASDLHVAVSRPPMLRVAADLVPFRTDPLTAAQTEAMFREILTDEEWERLEAQQQLDLCYYVPKAGRYRTNLFLDQKGLNGVFRVIPEKPPTIAEVGLPPHIEEIASYHQGLVVVCGPSGSGKSTTLAALVNLFNETRQAHIVTLEDPVEFVHPFKSCLVNHREIGADTASFARALRAALREDPDVIVIGDLRDNETVALALTAAETGHIVLGTLSATSANKAVDRLITSFPVTQQGQIRIALAESLKFIVAQRLLPAVEARRRVACFEVLKCTRAVSNLIREEKTGQIPSAMQIGRAVGMQTFDDALKDLVRTGRITPQTAYIAAHSKKEFETLVSDEFLESQTFV